MNPSGDLSDLKATKRTNSRGNGGTSFGLSRLLCFRPHLHRTCFRSSRKMGQDDPRDSGQIRQSARQPKDDPVDDPHPFGLLHRGGLQLLCLGTDPARWNLVGSSFRGGREEVDLYKCGERYAATVSRQPEPTKGLKSFLPQEIFIMNKNLDALSALIILEDYCNHKFTLSENIDIKTWLK